MRTVEIVLFENANGLDIAGPVEVFTVATKLLKRKGIKNKGYAVSFSANKSGLVTLGSGLKAEAERAIGNGATTESILVPGGLGVDNVLKDQKAICKIASRARKSKRIISVCTGAFILAEAGLLKGKSCTTHWSRAEQLAQHYPDINVVPDAIYVEYGNLFTSAGVTAGIDLALALVESDYGSALAIEVARVLVLYMRRSGGQSQFSAPMELRAKASAEFKSLHDWIVQNIDRSLLIDDLAEQTGMSSRNFSRHFAGVTGMTPGKYVELIRLGKARELLEAGQQSIDDVARASGFQREERLRRVFIRTLGITPSQYRIHFGTAQTLRMPSSKTQF